MFETKYKISFGSVEPKTFYKFEDGRMVCYIFSIHRDINGIETHRTTPEPISSIGYEDGTPFTEEDYKRIRNRS
jgi:hypothetical protein